jgi:hypothetical protein
MASNLKTEQSAKVDQHSYANEGYGRSEPLYETDTRKITYPNDRIKEQKVLLSEVLGE